MNKYTFLEIKEGQCSEFEAIIRQKDMDSFEEITGDKNPLHTDSEYIKETKFEKNVVYGQLVQSYFSTLAGMYLPGKYSLILNVNTNFRKPVFVGDKLRIRGTVRKKNALGQIITLSTEIKNEEKMIVANGTMMIKVLK